MTGDQNWGSIKLVSLFTRSYFLIINWNQTGVKNSDFLLKNIWAFGNLLSIPIQNCKRILHFLIRSGNFETVPIMQTKLEKAIFLNELNVNWIHVKSIMQTNFTKNAFPVKCSCLSHDRILEPPFGQNFIQSIRRFSISLNAILKATNKLPM